MIEKIKKLKKEITSVDNQIETVDGNIVSLEEDLHYAQGVKEALEIRKEEILDKIEKLKNSEEYQEWQRGQEENKTIVLPGQISLIEVLN